MNLDNIKKKIASDIGKEVTITVRGSRNRKEIYEGVLYRLYPNIFSLMTVMGEKSFSYADVATKDILIKIK